MHRRSLICLAIPAVLALALTTAAPASQAAAPPPPPHTQAKGARTTVTLLTGDQVTVSGKQPTSATIKPGPGRAHVRFRQYVADGHLHVVPTDVAPALAGRTIDPRLFDITTLVDAGYDDQHSKTIPLIVEGTATPKGATVRRQLRAVDAQAVTVDKREATAFFDASTHARIWLDGKRKLLLDQSVPQIGAPDAWNAGYTGADTTVAVLDSGIDQTHPDFAGAIQATRDFTGEGIGDTVGHGTHVASIITGSGAASGGKYKGVAPDAKLLVGKVCSTDWCDESAILEGMQWAAQEQDADVINLSIGGPDDEGLDVLEDAVNTLTEQTGSLFVVAAGNEGPSAQTISSPGSAAAALTVGAVDKSDGLADFSSRGPSPGDSGLKPDLTAPGLGVVAAHAEGTEIGTPVDDNYTSLDGTSMATPHVAGAAALLAQQHPGWTATELKSALTSSAEPDPEQSSFAQGAGRADLTRAIRQQVLPTQASLSFGKFEWPHHDNEPVVEQLTYANHGSTDVTLALDSSFAGPAGALTLSANELTVPAGGTATVNVTVDASFEGANGSFSGRITATAGDSRLITPLGLEREGEMYDLTFTSLDRNGGEPWIVSYSLMGLDNGIFRFFWPEKPTETLRLPAGRYVLDALIDTGEGEDSTGSLLVQPNFVLDQDKTWTADARVARPVNVTVEKPTAQRMSADITYQVITEFGGSATGVSPSRLSHVYIAQLGPDQPDPAFRAMVGTSWGEPGENEDFADSPYIYGVLDYQSHRFWTGYNSAIRDRDLARVEVRRNAQVDGHRGAHAIEGSPPGGIPGVRLGWGVGLPSETLLYLSGGVSWEQSLAEFEPPGEEFPVQLSGLTGTARTYQPGRTVTERWNAAAFTPGFTGGPYERAVRDGDVMRAVVRMYGDQEGHAGSTYALDSWSTTLYRDGQEVAVGEGPGVIWVEGLPADPAGYRLTVDADRSGAFDLSTKVSSAWEFRSGATETAQPLPLWAARFAPVVDDGNRVPARSHWVPMRMESNPGAPVGKLDSLTVRISTDDGATWQRIKPRHVSGNLWLLNVRPPTGAKHVSFDVSATDSKGNRMNQTTVRAYGLK